MTTLKEDGDSWKASGLKRRDFRHTHDDEPSPAKHPGTRRKKSTKKWCRGVVGREHVKNTRPWPKGRDVATAYGTELYCTVCHKSLKIEWKPRKWFRGSIR